MSSAVFRIAIGSQRRHLGLASAAMTSHQMCEALVPVAIGLIIDRAVDHGSTRTLLGWLAVLLVLFTVLSYSYRYGARWLGRHAARCDQRRRQGSGIRSRGRRDRVDPGQLVGDGPAGSLLGLFDDAQYAFGRTGPDRRRCGAARPDACGHV